MRINQNFEALWTCYFRIILLICSEYSFIAAEEIVDPVVSLFELLEGVDGEALCGELILIYVVNIDLALLRWYVSYDEVLL